ncbi:GNAT family N-acetyltransferase [Pseudomonas entomophila]|uniref:GNAT family N-acetyltransferase n=1 Tax=Pseudomonas entomophila TaxID=312306 RepID=UPI002406670F|nr:GNAT family N-acetyltransferase [Pseudomonas entomophila]MDF9620146.1 GNAT family N-acetyltransferase [Pseudomonas entomophila]
MRELFLHSRQVTFTWQQSEQFQLMDFDAQTEGEQILLAEIDGLCVGFISVWVPDHFIHHLYIAASHARQGIGRALLAALPGWPGTCYRLKCLVRNEGALAFYDACGFTEVDAGTGEEGDYLLLQSPR